MDSQADLSSLNVPAILLQCGALAHWKTVYSAIIVAMSKQKDCNLPFGLFFWSIISERIPFSIEEKAQNRFTRWPPWRPTGGVLIGRILATFHVQVTLIRSAKFRVSWAFDSGEEAQNSFQNGPEFLIYNLNQYFQDSPQLAFRFSTRSAK